MFTALTVCSAPAKSQLRRGEADSGPAVYRCTGREGEGGENTNHHPPGHTHYSHHGPCHLVRVGGWEGGLTGENVLYWFGPGSPSGGAGTVRAGPE